MKFGEAMAEAEIKVDTAKDAYEEAIVNVNELGIEAVLAWIAVTYGPHPLTINLEEALDLDMDDFEMTKSGHFFMMSRKAETEGTNEV